MANVSQSKIQVGKELKKSVAPCQILLDLPLSPHKAQTVILSNCYLCLLSHKAAAARCRYIHFMIRCLKMTRGRCTFVSSTFNT